MQVRVESCPLGLIVYSLETIMFYVMYCNIATYMIKSLEGLEKPFILCINRREPQKSG